jgi:hypothetical protein
MKRILPPLFLLFDAAFKTAAQHAFLKRSDDGTMLGRKVTSINDHRFFL